MKLEIKISYKKVINLGNNELVHIEAGISEEIENKDDRSYEDIFEELFDECEVFVLEKCDKELGEHKDVTTPLILDDDPPF